MKRIYDRETVTQIIKTVADGDTREALTADEVVAAGVSAGLSETAVRAALEAHEQKLRRREEFRQKVRGTVRGILGWAPVVLFLCGFAFLAVYEAGQAKLTREMNEVSLYRTRVIEAYAERGLTQRVLEATDNAHERAVIVDRIEHRIAIARHDYDDAVSTYNTDRAQQVFGRFYDDSTYPTTIGFAQSVWGTP